ncbi:hypothetical protein [Terrabacter terrigena]|uniref:Uncharacterized protein n=1 Tax=Terrabacter terrigena TaxID=574718 RepID=A0ABW3MUN6_9MICO
MREAGLTVLVDLARARDAQREVAGPGRRRGCGHLGDRGICGEQLEQVHDLPGVLGGDGRLGGL